MILISYMMFAVDFSFLIVLICEREFEVLSYLFYSRCRLQLVDIIHYWSAMHQYTLVVPAYVVFLVMALRRRNVYHLPELTFHLLYMLSKFLLLTIMLLLSHSQDRSTIESYVGFDLYYNVYYVWSFVYYCCFSLIQILYFTEGFFPFSTHLTFWIALLIWSVNVEKLMFMISCTI